MIEREIIWKEKDYHESVKKKDFVLMLAQKSESFVRRKIAKLLGY
jgi:hypothetical protein